MATVYVGKRPVLRGRSESEFANQAKTATLSGKARSAVGVYSYYPNYGPGLLTGAPDNNHVPGTGYSPHGTFMTRRFLGLDTKNPLDAPGSGARISGFRFHPNEFKGLAVAQALGNAGHAILTAAQRRALSYAQSDNFSFNGVAGAEPMKNPGHVVRYVNAVGTASSFGSFAPNLNKGVTTQPLTISNSYTQQYPTDYNHSYGKNRTLEWRGLPSAKAL